MGVKVDHEGEGRNLDSNRTQKDQVSAKQWLEDSTHLKNLQCLELGCFLGNQGTPTQIYGSPPVVDDVEQVVSAKLYGCLREKTTTM